MPGMGSGLDLNNPVLTSAFRSALSHQGLAVLLLLAACLLAWATLRTRRPAAGHARTAALPPAQPAPATPASSDPAVQPGAAAPATPAL